MKTITSRPTILSGTQPWFFSALAVVAQPVPRWKSRSRYFLPTVTRFAVSAASVRAVGAMVRFFQAAFEGLSVCLNAITPGLRSTVWFNGAVVTRYPCETHVAASISKKHWRRSGERPGSRVIRSSRGSNNAAIESYQRKRYLPAITSSARHGSEQHRRMYVLRPSQPDNVPGGKRTARWPKTVSCYRQSPSPTSRSAPHITLHRLFRDSRTDSQGNNAAFPLRDTMTPYQFTNTAGI